MTLMQRKFVTEYLIDRNATKAAVRAGYSERNADKIGSKTARKPHIAAAIAVGLEAAAKRRGVAGGRRQW